MALTWHKPHRVFSPSPLGNKPSPPRPSSVVTFSYTTRLPGRGGHGSPIYQISRYQRSLNQNFKFQPPLGFALPFFPPTPP